MTCEIRLTMPRRGAAASSRNDEPWGVIAWPGSR